MQLQPTVKQPAVTGGRYLYHQHKSRLARSRLVRWLCDERDPTQQGDVPDHGEV